MRTFIINWQVPVEIFYKFDQETNTYSFDSFDLPKKVSGVYQIVADHPLYGKRQVVYIGKAADIFDRNTQRFQEQNVPSKFWRLSNPVLIGIGLIYDSDNKPVTDSRIVFEIETLLIARHLPALNSIGLNRLSTEVFDLLLLNVGYTNGLLPDCAGEWFRISD